MNVTVLLFAQIREAFGTEKIKLAVPDGTTVGELGEKLLSGEWAPVSSAGVLLDGKVDGGAGLGSRFGLAGKRAEVALLPVSYAINESFVAPGTPLGEGDTVVLIPPVSGG